MECCKTLLILSVSNLGEGPDPGGERPSDSHPLRCGQVDEGEGLLRELGAEPASGAPPEGCRLSKVAGAGEVGSRGPGEEETRTGGVREGRHGTGENISHCFNVINLLIQFV